MKTEKTDKKQIGKPWQFQKGTSGNYKGRPKGTFSIVSLLKKKMEEVPEGYKLSFAESLINVLIIKAIKDQDIAAIREIINRIDGSAGR